MFAGNFLALFEKTTNRWISAFFLLSARSLARFASQALSIMYRAAPSILDAGNTEQSAFALGALSNAGQG